MFLRNPVSSEVFHPVPIALGEICKLCEINGSAGIRDRELVGQTCRVPASAFGPANAYPLSAGRGSARRSARSTHKSAAALFVKRLRRPDFELLRPAVVIRRRPQRP